MTPETLGHYRIVEKLSEGGWGTVYLAHDERLDRDVALKVLSVGTLADEDDRKRFRKEALTVAKLNHPNIGQIHDFDTQAGVDFLVMEYVGGGTLSRHMAGSALNEKEVAGLGMQIAQALEEAHEHGIIHRDLKPENIAMTPKGQVKVLDFGLAKLFDPSRGALNAETLTQSVDDPHLVGTLPYMAPEQVNGDHMDARTDIYALGVVLYEMATHQRPFREDSTPRLFDSILHQPVVPPRALNPRISPEMERIILKCLEKEPESRYQSAKELEVDLRHLFAPSSTAVPVATAPRARTWWWRTGTAVAIAVVVLIGFMFFRSRKAAALTERDTILLADFTNTTGESAFDGTMKQAMAVQLGQSPFLNLVPERRVRETLRFMGRSPDERVTGEVAREVCERQGNKAVLTGSIASLGSHYVLALDAVNCRTGESLAREQVEATSREQVLTILGKALSEMRGRLGESLHSIQEFDVPLTQATTPSLEAFKAYTEGRDQGNRGDSAAAIPFFKRAIELDPNFASAYANLGVVYMNMNSGESDLVAEYTKKAFALRERVSEREKFNISARYYDTVTGEQDKSIETMVVWKRTYPRDFVPVNNLGYAYERMGELEKAAAEYREAIALNPQPAIPYQNLGRVLLFLNQVDEAKAILQEANTKKQDFINTHLWLFEIAFAQGNTAAMQREVEWAAGNPEEGSMLWEQSSAALSEGKLENARQFIRRANELAARQNLPSDVAVAQAFLAEYAAFFGECQPTREAAPAMRSAPDREAMLRFSLALAFCGQSSQAQALADDLAKRWPADTLLNAAELPSVRAGIELNRGNPARAIELLQAAWPYERLRPRITYLRALAYLRAGKGAEAAAEFQKIAGAKGTDPTSPEHALAYLGEGRAYVLTGDTAKARDAYKHLLKLWKDAEPDIPVVIAAKSESAKLQ